LLFFERPDSGERAVLVHIDFSDDDAAEDALEFEQLALAAGADPVALITGKRHAPLPRYFIGEGKLEEIADAARTEEAELVIFNHSLSPSQERNIEKALKCRVVDRTGLILDIFAQRARTHEGKLQVELAQLSHLSTRLVRGWTHLERQKGGIGLRGGAGETQLEADRRMLRTRIQSINKRLDKVRHSRQQSRKARQRAEIPTVSIVGYTNAGKSTLFNQITNSEVYAADQLFATLDPTLRRLSLPDLGPVVLADTVGFIRNLPHKLVDAFRATLEETVQADLLIHVVDASSHERDENIAQVCSVLAEIGADKIPVLEVFNKIDLMGDRPPFLERDEDDKPRRLWLSARENKGLDLLISSLSELLANDMIEGSITLAPKHGGLRSKLYKNKVVLHEENSDQGESILDIRLPHKDLLQLLKQAKLSAADVCLQEKNPQK